MAEQPEKQQEETAAVAATEPLLIQVVSDLHIEFYDTFEDIPRDIILPPSKDNPPDILALLGDIGLACTEQLEEFLLAQADRFATVIFVPGNHEYYNHTGKNRTGYTVDQQAAAMRKVCDKRWNLIYMDNDSILVNGVRILASTLWSHIPKERYEVAQKMMNDYHLSYVRSRGDDDDGKETTTTTTTTTTELLTPECTSQWHAESVDFLTREIALAEQRQEKVVVLTHHAPSLEGTSDPKDNDSELLCCAGTNLKSLMRPPVVAWACGHTHWNFDMPVTGSSGKNAETGTSSSSHTVRVVSNQRGYAGQEITTYDNRGLILEIPP